MNRMVSRARIVMRRGGYVLMEGVIALGLSVIVGIALCTALSTQSRVARVVGERIAHNDAARATRHILDAELRMIDPRADLRALAVDSVNARLVRASGVFCASQGAVVWLRLRGIRTPDDTKDSMIVVTADRERIYPFSGLTRDQTRCAAGPGEQVYRWNAGAAAPDLEGAILVFESGSYYLSQRALRYRIGGEGRQPLTEEFLRDGLSFFAGDVSDTVSCPHLRVSLAMKPRTAETVGRTRSAMIAFTNARRCP